MHSILLVDDEKIELETLTTYVPWEAMGIRVIGTARNGREALELTQQLDPDIILTDVRMPIMDGLEFVKRAKQVRKRVKIVFLSGHDEFQYIKAALAVEASGYLLKPIDMEELRHLMEKVKQKCEEAKLAERSEEMAKEKLLRMLLMEETPDRRAELAQRLLQLDSIASPPLRGPFKAACLVIDRPSRNDGAAADSGMPDPLERSIGEAVHNRLKALGYIGELIDWEYRTFAGVFPDSLFDGERETWQQLQKLIEADFPVSLTIGLSRASERLEDAHDLFKEAHDAAKQAFYFGNGALLAAEDVHKPSTDEVEVEEHRAALCRAIVHQRSEETEQEVALFIHRLREKHVHPHLARSAAVRLITAVEQHFSGAIHELQIGPFSSEWEIMSHCQTLDEIGEHVLHVCHSLIMALSEKDKDRHQHIAKQIQDIIDRSYHKPLTVEDIAKEVYLSPNYIRTIYKEKTGRTILEVITGTLVPGLIHRLLIRPFLNMHLRNKLFVVFGLVSVIPLIFLAIYSYETMKSELTRQMYSNMLSTTDQIGSNLKMKLDSYSKVSSSLYLDSRLRDFLTMDYSSGNNQYVDAYEYINSSFRNLLVTNTDLSSVTVYTTNLTLPTDQVFIKRADKDLMRYPWYSLASKSYGSVTFTVMPATNPSSEQVTQGIEERKPSRIVLARLLDNNSLNYPYGILTMDIPEVDIYALMAKENNNKELFIVSEDGAIISGKDKNKINHNLKEFVQGDWGNSKAGSFIGMYKGERVFVVYNSIDNGWKTVSIVSYNSLLMNVKIAFSRLFTIAIASLILSIILIYIMARWFTIRIEKLLQLTRRIESEDFDVQAVSTWHDEVGLLSFAMTKMARRMKELINEVYKKEIAKKEAEMSMLQAQINPHFLYNTLASISSLAMRSDDNRIQDMVTHLAKFYRISLNKGKTIVGFAEELRLTKSYIAIQQLRFEGLLHVHYDIEEAALPYPVIKLMLQPFIENAINHGIWDDEAGINVIIRACIKDDTLMLEVIDDGMGMRPEKLQRIHGEEDSDGVSGYGIRNVDRRIKLTFGDSYGVHIYSRLGIGTAVQILIPLRGAL